MNFEFGKVGISGFSDRIYVSMGYALGRSALEWNGVFHRQIFTCLIYICKDQLLFQIRDFVL